MRRYPAFVITPFTTPDGACPPGLDQAAAWARDTAIDAALRLPGWPAPQSLALGCARYRFIQGCLEENHEIFAGLPPENWPQLTHTFWSATDGNSPHAEAVPADVLECAWSSAQALVAFALDNHHSRPAPYPSLMITPDGALRHELAHPQCDVFGNPQPRQDAPHSQRNGHLAQWMQATQPLRSLERVLFRIDYLKALRSHSNHLVLALEWTTPQNHPAKQEPDTR